jgi:hippurate hydrolase
MRHLWPVLAIVVAPAAARANPGMHTRVEQALPDLLATYRHLHQNPELSLQEKRTAAYLAGRLRSLGFDVTQGFGKLDEAGAASHGLVGVLHNGPGPTVLVRTDMDALPVREKTGLPYASTAKAHQSGTPVPVMHACGHDLHMTAFLGAARVLSELRSAWSGTLLFVGQPAEERGMGARAMLAGGLYTRFRRPDYAIALHMKAGLESSKVGYREGYALANVDTVDVVLRGRGGHGAYPHNAKDPIVLAAQYVLALQTIVSREKSPLEPAVVTVGSIHGGAKHNVIPDEVRLQLTVRTFDEAVRRTVLAALERIVRGLAEAAGVPADRAPTVTVDPREFTPATYNDPELTRRLVGALRPELGAQNVVPVPPVMGGEDFGLYGDGRKIPIALLWLGAADPAMLERRRAQGKPPPPLHSARFAPHAEPAIRTGVKALTAAVLDLLRKG